VRAVNYAPSRARTSVFARQGNRRRTVEEQRGYGALGVLAGSLTSAKPLTLNPAIWVRRFLPIDPMMVIVVAYFATMQTGEETLSVIRVGPG
jgi:hypothetical protein